jgi:hypothetical protein
MTWANLLSAFRGLNRARLLLAAWEGLLWLILWAAGCLLPWWGLFVGGVVAFILHEVCFQFYVEAIVKLPETFHPQPGYTPCLERWTGPVA